MREERVRPVVRFRELRLATFVQLNKALGGGWQESHPAIYSQAASGQPESVSP
jgi:hypothetical protein